MRFRLVLPAVLLLACALSAAFAAPAPAAASKPWKPKAPAGSPAPAPASAAPAAPSAPAVHYLPDTTWLAQVGPRVTRAGDFTREYLAAYPPDRPSADSSGRVQFLTTLINKDLLALTARQRNTPLTFEDRSSLHEAEERALSDVFYQRFVVAHAYVTDAEVREYVEQRGLEGHFRRILFGDRPTAERVRARIVSGTLPWAVAVQQYSRQRPSPRNPDGDLGWVARTGMPDMAGIELFRLQPGGYSPVLQSPAGGFEITQMIARRPAAKAPPKDALLGFVRNQLRNYHMALLTDSIQTALMKRAGMAFDSANVAFASSHFTKAMNLTHEGGNATMEISEDVPDFSPPDMARVLASWKDGGQYTVAQLIAWYHAMAPPTRPDITYPAAMEGSIAGVVLEPYRAVVAREEGLDKDPDVIRIIEGKHDQILVEHLYADSVTSGLTVSAEERRAYYDHHLPDYFSFPAVDFAILYRYSEASADSVKKALDAGAKPWDIIAADSLRGEKTGSLKHRNTEEKGPYQKILFEELRPGQSRVVGPDPRGVYGVVNLLAYDPGRQLLFAEVEGLVDQSVQNTKLEAKMNAWLSRIRQRIPVTWRPELVMHVNLATPVQ